MSKQEKVTVPYTIIPLVPNDFDGAVESHRQAVEAIHWCKEAIRYYNDWTEEYQTAKVFLPKWQVVRDEAAKVIKSFQLPLF